MGQLVEGQVADIGPEPLHRFPVFRTSDPEELRYFGSTFLGASRIDLETTDSFQACVNLIELQETGLAFGATSCYLAADHVASDFIRLQISMKGRATASAGRVTADINQRQFAITPAGVSSRTVCQAGHERLTVRLDPQALLQRLTILLGVKPKGDIRFEPAIGADGVHAQGLYQLVLFLAQQLDSTASRLPAAACRELEQAVQIAFLWASRHPFSHLLEAEASRPAPLVVRRVEEFIEAHWREAITIDRLVAEAGVSARSIFRAFDRSRGYSPMAFVKSVRLRHAREVLMSGDPDVSVMATAFKCNFTSPGHFARDYREAFGELPSDTISRARL
jgi:AraC-like DNA-binding protein